MTEKKREIEKPVEWASDQDILSVVKWSIRSMAKGTITPEQGRGVIDGCERLLRMKRFVSTQGSGIDNEAVEDNAPDDADQDNADRATVVKTNASADQAIEDEAWTEYKKRSDKQETME